MRRRVPFADRLLDLIFNGARDLVAFVDAAVGWNHDVKIDPVVSPAVAMTELVITADVRLRARGREM